jgi:hypothetical protein
VGQTLDPVCERDVINIPQGVYRGSSESSCSVSDYLGILSAGLPYRFATTRFTGKTLLRAGVPDQVP